MKGDVGLHVVERKFEQINRLLRLRQRLESSPQVVAVVEERAACTIGKVLQGALLRVDLQDGVWIAVIVVSGLEACV